MTLEFFRLHCLAKNGVTEELPFDANTLVYKVRGKMFALTDLQLFESINLKCDPEKAVQLREEHAAVLPGYHMNKRHWNTILMDGSVSDKMLMSWIDESYALVVATLPKVKRRGL